MPKIKINVTILSSNQKIEYKIKALINEKEKYIVYHEPTSEQTKVKYDYEKKILIRENKDIYMKYIFNPNKQTESEITIKELNRKTFLPINTISMINNFWNILIKYQIEQERFEYKIEVIE